MLATRILRVLAALSAAGAAHGVLLRCAPVMHILEPAFGAIIAMQEGSNIRVDIVYEVVAPCEAVASPRRAATSRHSPDLDAFAAAHGLHHHVIELSEHQFHDAGYVAAPLGEGINIVVAEPGSYSFEARLMHAPPSGNATVISRALVLFTLVFDAPTAVQPTIEAAFDAGVNSYGIAGVATPIRMPRAGHAPPVHPEGDVQYEGVPLAPLRVAVIGSVGRNFDGTKQFLVQYETVMDRRLVECTHIDMAEDESTGATRVMALMLAAANVSVLYRQLSLRGGDFAAPREFLDAGARVGRLQSVCELSERLRFALMPFIQDLQRFDVMWHVNHDHLEDYFSQVSRLVRPAMPRIWDLVGRITAPCRYSRADHYHAAGHTYARTAPRRSRVVDLGELRSADQVQSLCPTRDDGTGLPADVLPSSWLQESYEGAYMHAQYVRDLDASRMNCSHMEHAPSCRQSMDMPRRSETHDPRVSLPNFAAARSQWQMQAHEMVVTPSQFVAQLPVVRSYGLNTLVIPGLHRAIGRLQPRDTNPRMPPSIASRRACSLVWANAAHPKGGKLARRPIVVAFIGRLSREKGAALFVAAVDRVRALLSVAPMDAITLNDVRFVVIGNAASQYDTSLHALADALGVAHLLSFAGFVQPAALQRLYEHRCVDIVVTPYLRPMSETFGLVITEAMAAEVAIVTFRVGGVNDYARHGYNVLVPAQMTPESIAVEVKALLYNATLRHALGARARGYIESHVNTHSMAVFMQRVLRREAVLRRLGMDHVTGGLDHVVAMHEAGSPFACGPPHTAASTQLVWADVLTQILETKQQSSHALSATTLRCDAMQMPLRYNARTQLILSVTAAGDRDEVQVELHLRLMQIVSPAAANESSSGAAWAHMIRPGFADVLCDSAEHEHAPRCTPARAHAQAASLVAEFVARSTQLCITSRSAVHERKNSSIESLFAASICFYGMDLPGDALEVLPFQSRDGSVIPLLRATMYLPQVAHAWLIDGDLLMALTEARLPYTVLAGVSCIAAA